MSKIIIGTVDVFFGIIDKPMRPKLPKGFVERYGLNDWATAKSPDGKEYFIGAKALTRKNYDHAGNRYMDESETISLK